MNNDCIFCKIVRKEIPAEVVHEDNLAIVFKSKYPVSESHLLIVPKTHIGTFLDVDDETVSALKNIAKQLIEKFDIQGGYKLVINGGKFQAIKHFHWHLLAGNLEDEKSILSKT